MKNTLPEGFYVRRPALADLQAVLEVIQAGELAESGHIETSGADLRTRWTASTYDPARDGWLMIAPGERVVAHLYLGHTKAENMRLRVPVHPDYASPELYACLLELAIARAHELLPEAQADARVTLNTHCGQNNDLRRGALEQAGFTRVRSDWTMQIDMDQPPPIPVWPEHIALRPYTPDMAQAVFEADEDAFQDHWGHTPGDFVQWQNWTVKREDFDPGLWFLAFAGDEITAIALCEYTLDTAWVGELGVRRPWRRQGLALALLYHAFGEFYRRGVRQVLLTVDSQSLTGATRLYTRAGMRVVRQTDRYQLELRPGLELSTQELSI